jgi:hypothetical protein
MPHSERQNLNRNKLMKDIRSNFTNITKRTKLFVATGIVIPGSSSVLAFNQFDTSKADVMSPTEVRVNQHEDRLTQNEAENNATKQRVDQVEQKTAENSQVITNTTERVTVIERQAAQQEGARAVASAPVVAEVAPEPVKTVKPRLMVNVKATEQFDRFGNTTGWHCISKLEQGTSHVNIQPDACYTVGTERVSITSHGFLTMVSTSTSCNTPASKTRYMKGTK